MTGDVVHVDPEVASLLREVAGQKASLLFAKPRWPDTRQYIRPSATGLTAPERELVVRHREYLAYLLRRAVWEGTLRDDCLRTRIQTFFRHLPRAQAPPHGELSAAQRLASSTETDRVLGLIRKLSGSGGTHRLYKEWLLLGNCAARLEPSARSKAYVAVAFSHLGRRLDARAIYEDILGTQSPFVIRYAVSINAASCLFLDGYYSKALQYLRPYIDNPDTEKAVAPYWFLYALLQGNADEVRAANAALERRPGTAAASHQMLDEISKADLHRARRISAPSFLCSAARGIVAAVQRGAL